jgi:hypothetical protein
MNGNSPTQTVTLQVEILVDLDELMDFHGGFGGVDAMSEYVREYTELALARYAPLFAKVTVTR